MNAESESMRAYFELIDRNVTECYNIAKKARKLGYDPELFVDVKLAKNMAERVEGLLSAVAPQLVGKGLPKKIDEYEKKYSPLDWRVALLIARDVAKEKFCKFKDKKEAMEIGIRTGFAYQTGGIVAAPLEGFIELKIKKRRDGKEYLAPCYAGPIRGAGGTAAAFSLLLTDFVRVSMGYESYDPDENEINRYKREILDYNERVTNLQYLPSAEEIGFLMKNIPIEPDGDPTEKIEVSNFKGLDRIATDRIRGGMALVLAEGLAQKAPKLWKRLEKWGHDFGLEQWDFLKDFLALQKKIKAKQKPEKKEDKQKLSPNYTFIADLVAGRPVLTFPMRSGGFRLRYGRTRCSGFSAASVNPATMYFLNDFIAIGTQLKVERPGKAASITPCDSIYGPIVRLKDGAVVRVNSVDEAKKYAKEAEKILFLGDILFNYGDFSENNHVLVPAGITEEEWLRHLEKATVDMFGMLDKEKLSEMISIDSEKLDFLFSNPFKVALSFRAARAISEKLKVPLHPDFCYYWKLLEKGELMSLISWMKKAKLFFKDDKKGFDMIRKAVLPYDSENKKLLEKAGIPHICASKEFIVLKEKHAKAVLFSLGFSHDLAMAESKLEIASSSEDSLDAVNRLSGVIIKDKAGTFVGARMGRPEKAKMRKMAGSPQVLFPVGEEGGRLRSFQSALEKGKITAEFPLYFCEKCNSYSPYRICYACGKKTKQRFFCKECNEVIEKEECPKHGAAKPYKLQELNIKELFSSAVKLFGSRAYPDLIKGVRGTSNKDHIPEFLLKGIIRAKHNVFVNKDGTVRYDMTELPLTHFKPSEIGASVEKLNELGYEKDCKGRELVSSDQVVELKPQDLVLPWPEKTADEPASSVLFRVACFVDELLVKLYKQEPYYNLKKPQDLIGHYVIGLAPHISAGTVGRIIGFSKTQGLFAHPLFHAAMRRDCDGDEACVILLLDAFLNFSRQYLPDSRGAKTMDAPLVLTSKIMPTEVDDMVHGLDVVWGYPLELYQQAEKLKPCYELKIEQLKQHLNTPRQYEGIGYTHETSSINSGICFSAYKFLPSMEEKIAGQMDIAEKISAVDESEVAKFIIEKHLLKDTKGNLRKFSTQQFRCVGCNEKFRRPPLIGKCTKCGGKIIFTVPYGAVVKYLSHSINLASKYNVTDYLKQSLELLQLRIESLFGKEKEKQEGLDKWF